MPVSPEAIGALRPKHVRSLERRMRHLQAVKATGRANDWTLAELSALTKAIAVLNEVMAG